MKQKPKEFYDFWTKASPYLRTRRKNNTKGMSQKKKEKETEHLLSNLREFQVINWHNGFLCFASCLHKFVSWQAFHRWRPVLAFMDMDVDSLLALLSPYRMSGWFPLLAWQRLPCQVLFIFPSLFSILVRKALQKEHCAQSPRTREAQKRCDLQNHVSTLACSSPLRPQALNCANGLIPWEFNQSQVISLQSKYRRGQGHWLF